MNWKPLGLLIFFCSINEEKSFIILAFPLLVCVLSWHSKLRFFFEDFQCSFVCLQGHKEWVTEVNVLGVVEHPNLVKLIGYCAEDDERGIQRLLIYEYMPNRSVQDHLTSRFQATLPWNTRLKIAQDAARGLAYLHEGMDFQVLSYQIVASW